MAVGKITLRLHNKENNTHNLVRISNRMQGLKAAESDRMLIGIMPGFLSTSISTNIETKKRDFVPILRPSTGTGTVLWKDSDAKL